MQAPTRGEITGLVLAGGRAARMGGVDKGLADYLGQPLAQHALERLRPQVSRTVISANRNLERYHALGVPVVLDEDEGLEPFPGPLAGMLAGLRWMRTPWVACVPCDAPYLPLDLVAQLARGVGCARAAVACAADRMQPVFCLLHNDLADDLAQSLQHGQRKAEAWLRAIGAVQVPFADATAFVNFNTELDLKRDNGRR